MRQRGCLLLLARSKTDLSLQVDWQPLRRAVVLGKGQLPLLHRQHVHLDISRHTYVVQVELRLQ
jgi:hypothetical protein